MDSTTSQQPSLATKASATFVTAFINTACGLRRAREAWDLIPAHLQPVVKGVSLFVALFVWLVGSRFKQERSDRQKRALFLKATSALIGLLCLVVLGSTCYLFSVSEEPKPALDSTRIMWAIVLLYSLAINFYFR